MAAFEQWTDSRESGNFNVSVNGSKTNAAFPPVKMMQASRTTNDVLGAYILHETPQQPVIFPKRSAFSLALNYSQYCFDNDRSGSLTAPFTASIVNERVTHRSTRLKVFTVINATTNTALTQCSNERAKKALENIANMVWLADMYKVELFEAATGREDLIRFQSI